MSVGEMSRHGVQRQSVWAHRVAGTVDLNPRGVFNPRVVALGPEIVQVTQDNGDREENAQNHPVLIPDGGVDEDGRLETNKTTCSQMRSTRLAVVNHLHIRK